MPREFVNRTIIDTNISSAPSCSQEAFEDLQSRYKTQEADLENQKKALKAAQIDTTAAREEVTLLRKEISVLKSDLEGLENYVRDLRERHKSLQKAQQDLKEQLDGKAVVSSDTATKLEARISELGVQPTEQVTKLEERITELDGKARTSDARINELQLRVGQLERERDLKEPLFKIGVAIRLRYLELARVPLFNVHNSKLNQELIKRGNAAAHHGMGSVDATLFQGDILSNTWKAVKRNFIIVFNGLYRSKPANYGSMPSKKMEALDCEATIRTLVVVSNQRLVNTRLVAMEHLDFIKAKYEKLTGEAFEEDKDVAWRLDRLKELTEDIVESDRQRKAVKQHGMLCS
jgi:hypothetical protein